MSEGKKKLEVDTVGKRGDSSKKKLILVGSAVVIAAVAFNGFIASQTGDDAPQREARPVGIDFTPAGLEQESFESQTQSAIKKLRDSDNRISTEIAEAQEDLAHMEANQREFQEDSRRALGEISQQLREMRAEQNRLKEEQSANETRNESSGQGSMGAVPPPDQPGKRIDQVPPPPRFGEPQRRTEAVADNAEPKTEKKSGATVLRPPEGEDSDDVVKVSTSRELNEYAGWLSSGFLPVTTLTGVQAGTASSSQQNPSPILMRVQGDVTLPGSARYDLKGCFINGTSYGDARTHRALTDVATLSCVDKRDHLVLEETITGYVVDSDGIQGLRGKLIERRGAILAKATLASMFEGLGEALSDAQGTTFDNATGAGQIISGQDALRSSGFNAAAGGARTLSDFYLEELERLFPVIEVPPNRKAAVIITKGKSLKWHDSGSIYKTKKTPES